MKKILILVVDDDPSLVDFLVTALKSAKYEVEAAYGGEQGIKKAKEGKPCKSKHGRVVTPFLGWVSDCIE